MSLNLMTVFKTSDLQKFGQTASNVVSLAFKTNKKRRTTKKPWTFKNIFWICSWSRKNLCHA